MKEEIKELIKRYERESTYLERAFSTCDREFDDILLEMFQVSNDFVEELKEILEIE